MKTLLAILLTTLSLCCNFTPYSSVPNTYTLGWWSHQDDFHIESIDAKFKYPGFGLFKHKNILTITIKGEIIGRKSWKAKIKRVHLSQEMIYKTSKSNPEATIIVTPVVEANYDKSYPGGSIPFEITQFLPIYSIGYGKNTFHIKCDQLTTDASFHQGK